MRLSGPSLANAYRSQPSKRHSGPKRLRPDLGDTDELSIICILGGATRPMQTRELTTTYREHEPLPQTILPRRAPQPTSGRPAGNEHEALTLPTYVPLLAAYHQAFAGELRAIVAALPLHPGSLVLDVACGDGSYAGWMAPHVGPTGHIIGADLSRDYLMLAQRRVHPGVETSSHFIAGEATRLPFADRTFDLVWCAHSLYSLPEPVAVIREMHRVVRPGGVVAVLENDPVHHLILPWPVELEFAIRRAEWRALAADGNPLRTLHVARGLFATFRRAGFEQCRLRTYASDRHAPLDPDEQAFIEAYLQDLQRRVDPYLDASSQRQLERLLDPACASFLLNSPEVAFTCLDHVIWGITPYRA
jgi:ubiquinone/menaquinone biosynthesis C-methylase UbiE